MALEFPAMERFVGSRCGEGHLVDYCRADARQRENSKVLG
jgi:hypothetical protein